MAIQTYQLASINPGVGVYLFDFTSTGEASDLIVNELKGKFTIKKMPVPITDNEFIESDSAKILLWIADSEDALIRWKNALRTSNFDLFDLRICWAVSAVPISETESNSIIFASGFSLVSASSQADMICGSSTLLRLIDSPSWIVGVDYADIQEYFLASKVSQMRRFRGEAPHNKNSCESNLLTDMERYLKELNSTKQYSILICAAKGRNVSGNAMLSILNSTGELLDDYNLKHSVVGVIDSDAIKDIEIELFIYVATH